MAPSTATTTPPRQTPTARAAPSPPTHASVPEWHRLQDPRVQATLRVQDAILHHAREVLRELGHKEALAPVIGPVTDPGIRGASQVAVDYCGTQYKVMSSAILYKQLLLHAHDKLFLIAPCIRLEPDATRDTGRHLSEFYQLDVEIRDGSLDDATATAEHLLRETVHRVQQSHADDLALLGAPAWDLAAPFLRLTHAEAVAQVRALGGTAPDDGELPWEAERLLSQHADRPIILERYPRSARGFYDREDPDEPGILLDFDVLYPGGYGEACSGAEREHDADTVAARIRDGGEDPAAYGWYLEMLRDGCPPSAGFGFGIERLTRFVCRLGSVRDARAFPKAPGLAPGSP